MLRVLRDAERGGGTRLLSLDAGRDTLDGGPLRVSRSVTIPEGELRWRFSHVGAGRPSVNTADSRVQLSLDLTTTTALGPVNGPELERLAGRLTDGVLTVSAQEERSQLRNRETAEERLRSILAEALALPPRPRRPTRPTKASVERRLTVKKRRSRTAAPPRRRRVLKGQAPNRSIGSRCTTRGSRCPIPWCAAL